MNTGGIFAWMCINQDSLIIVWSLKKKIFSGRKLQWFISCSHHMPREDQLRALTIISKLMKQPLSETLPANATEEKENTKLPQHPPGSDTHFGFS